MKFDFNLGIEAVFDEWVDDGCKRALAILEAIEKVDSASAAKLINQDAAIVDAITN